MLIKLLLSRGGIIVMIALALFSWHRLDKGSAVRQAVTRYVADVELQAAGAERDQLSHKLLVANTATARLEEKVAASEGENLLLENELKEWELQHESPIDGTVGADLFGQLRSQ